MRAQCCICADLFENSATVNIAAAPCGHTFHEMCLMRWMDTSSTCPSCRTHVKKTQIIKRLFFDISEGVSEDENVERLLNQVGNLKAQLNEKDKQKQDLAEARDTYAARLAACESENEDLLLKISEERNVRDIMQRDLKLLRKENAAYVEEMKEFRKTQRKLEELQNVEMILKGCDSDIQAMVSQYSEGGESSVKQLASLVTVMKREYNQVVADKKTLREQVAKLKRLIGHHNSDAQKSKQELQEIKAELEKTYEQLNKSEKENNENRRKLVHLRNALRYNKTEGSQSFYKAVNEDSPNVAFTPPNFPPGTNSESMDEDEENCPSPIKDVCVTPDLFDDSPNVRKKMNKHTAFEDADGPKLKFVNVPTAADRIKAAKRARLKEVEDDAPKVPEAMFSIMQKKLTGQSNSRTHVPSVITRGYDGFGGSTTCVHPLGRAKVASMKAMVSKKKVVKKQPGINAKFLTNQPRLKECIQLFPSSSAEASSTSSTSLSQDEDISEQSKSGSCAGGKKSSNKEVPNMSNMFKRTSSTTLAAGFSSSKCQTAPKLTSNLSGFIDLT